ncbi:hypothetical protein Tsubulata_039820 [Turnera subulata]|uniref:non-specific serine/threonine protein kinase n=1 Tax=Turnera subulata TaxID=218843 RepID=A0A9Q0G1K9_9ROSI|nr:hypothetical protein Tsubulata_039820 [Turnera subulata]
MLAMEKDFDSKLRIQSNNNSSSSSSASNNNNNGSNNGNVQRSKSFAFRAPQENFSIQDFELGKIYGVGSYSKIDRLCCLVTISVDYLIVTNSLVYVPRLVVPDRGFLVSGSTLSIDIRNLVPADVETEIVVRAKKKDSGMVYALKIMDKKFITKENKTAYVKLERIVLDQLDHPGIVRLYFTFQDNYSLYMALESCEGGELFDQITRPENLLLTAEGHIKIADFGSVKPMQDSRITVLPNAASDDKACTFVGTAAYVPPEVLNSSPATFGNDLWALGCTLYQMLSGTSPFKDASEWLIFQRIIARDIRFPNYFSDEARDLIDRLLDIDPTRRPGAGPGGYAALKMHPFFRGIDWKNLRERTPPVLALEQAVVLVSRQQFLDPGESVIMISGVKRLQKLTSKKVQLILTNKPKLIYVDPSKLVIKGNIIWSDNSNDLSIQVTSPTNFKIVTPKKVMSFEDAKQRAWQWKKAIESLQNR